nr:MAG TPA: large terminase [Caudoviricetes sp.]
MMQVVKFSKKQLQVLAFPNSSYDALICDGSVRSGKTSVMSVAFVLWAMRGFNKQNFGICSKTDKTCLRNVIRPLMAMAYMQTHFSMQLHIASGDLVISDGKHTNTFYIYGGKDEASYQKIQGVTLAGVFLDEVALMPRSFVEQALARCSVSGRKYWFNCNPAGQMHWFYQNWILKAKEHNALRLHFLMDDNPGLSEEIKKGYESTFSGIFYDLYILGLWVTAEGLVYDMFSDANILDEEPETIGDYFVSSDFGIQNATTFLLWRRIAGTDDWLCLSEYYYSGREERKQKTVAELVDGLVQMLGERNADPKQVIIDPSAAALKVEIRKRGLHAKDADNDVINGIADVSNLLERKRLKFMRRCKNTIQEFGVYAWNAKALERGEEKPEKETDHCMDAVRYFARTKRIAVKTQAALDTKMRQGNYML